MRSLYVSPAEPLPPAVAAIGVVVLVAGAGSHWSVPSTGCMSSSYDMPGLSAGSVGDGVGVAPVCGTAIQSSVSVFGLVGVVGPFGVGGTISMNPFAFAGTVVLLVSGCDVICK